MYNEVNLPRHAKPKREVSKEDICQRNTEYGRNIIIDQEIVTDEENKIWDFSFNAITSKFYNENISKKSIVETLD